MPREAAGASTAEPVRGPGAERQALVHRQTSRPRRSAASPATAETFIITKVNAIAREPLARLEQRARERQAVEHALCRERHRVERGCRARAPGSRRRARPAPRAPPAGRACATRYCSHTGLTKGTQQPRLLREDLVVAGERARLAARLGARRRPTRGRRRSRARRTRCGSRPARRASARARRRAASPAGSGVQQRAAQRVDRAGGAERGPDAALVAAQPLLVLQ